MLPTEIEHKSFCVQQFNEEQSDDSWVNDLTRLDELREVVVIQLAKHQQGTLVHVAFLLGFRITKDSND
jgi:hypothetical protein